MSDLNKKNINYGALNRFYQDLKSHDISTLNDKIDNIDLSDYEKKIDYVIGLSQSAPGAMPTLDLSNLDDVTTDGIYNIAIVSDIYGTGNEYFGTGKLAVQNLGEGNGVTQTLSLVSNYAMPKQELIVRDYDGSTWREQSYPCALIVPQGYEQIVPYATYSATKINELINAYEIPVASSSILGGVKIGDGLNINSSGILSPNIIMSNAMYSILKGMVDDIYSTYDSLSENEKYLTIEATEDNTTVSYQRGNTTNSKPIKYSFDLENWIEISPSKNQTINLPKISTGERIFIKGDNNTYNGYYSFQNDKNCYYYGNIMSLLDSVNFSNLVALSNNNELKGLFKNNTHLIMNNSKKILLPATTLTENCYQELFAGCTSLTITPELPATSLQQYCYSMMFKNCTNLTSVPVLSATTLAWSCYYQMFYGCTSLTTAPVLSSSNLNGTRGYYEMFYGCTSLNEITCLATNIDNNATTNWLYNVSSTGTFYKDSSMSSWTTGVSGIPSGWTVQDYVAPSA